jgi:hypothetical protein
MKRLHVVLLASFTLALSAFTGSAYAQAAYAAANTTVCRETEQHGCFEIDILNLVAPANFDRGRDGKPDAMAYYQKYIDGQVRPAKARTYTVYFWAINPVSPQSMAEYRLPSNYPSVVQDNRRSRRTTKLSWGPVTSVSTAGAPIFDPAYQNRGAAQAAFRVSSPYGGAAIQFPTHMLTPQTLVLICADNAQDQGIFPNRMHGAQDGIWLTGAELLAGKQFFLAWPFLFKG